MKQSKKKKTIGNKGKTNRKGFNWIYRKNFIQIGYILRYDIHISN